MATERAGAATQPTGAASPAARGERELEDEAALAGLRRYARLLDASVGIPGTSIRMGVDSIVGLIPGVGDAIGFGLSLWIVYRARQLGASRRVLARMLSNVGFETLVGTVPLVGDAFDVWFHANRRNVELLEKHISESGFRRR